MSLSLRDFRTRRKGPRYGGPFSVPVAETEAIEDLMANVSGDRSPRGPEPVVGGLRWLRPCSSSNVSPRD